MCPITLTHHILHFKVVVVANVNSLPGSRDYATFYNTALRYLEKDPFQEVAFTVNTHIPKTDSKKISMYLWNGTIVCIIYVKECIYVIIPSHGRDSCRAYFTLSVDISWTSRSTGSIM